MSKWFATGDSASEDEMPVKQEDQAPEEEKKISKKPAARKYVSSSESEEEGGKKIVKSTKQKRLDEIQGAVVALKKNIANRKFKDLMLDLERLVKTHEIAIRTVPAAEAARPFARGLVAIDDFVSKLFENEEEREQLSAKESADFRQLRTKAKKATQGFEKQIEEYRANPINSADEAAASSTRRPRRQAAAASADSDSDESDAESESEDEKKPAVPAKLPAGVSARLAQWLRKPEESESEVSQDDLDETDSEWDESESGSGSDDSSSNSDDSDSDDSDSDSDSESESESEEEAEKISAEQAELNVIWTEELVEQKLRELIDSRGRRNKSSMLRLLAVMAANTTNALRTLEIYCLAASVAFEALPSTSIASISSFRTCINSIANILNTLEENETIAIAEDGEGSPERLTKAGFKSVVGVLAIFLDRLDSEYDRALQDSDPMLPEYLTRVSDEAVLVELMDRAMVYYDRIGDRKRVLRFAALLLQLIYYRRDSDHERRIRAAPSSSGTTGINKPISAATRSKFRVTSSLSQSLENLSSLLLNGSSTTEERYRVRCILCLVYYHAQHDHFLQARDMLLAGKIQDVIASADVSTQILFNRAVAVLGMAAFRAGFMAESQFMLSEFNNSMRIRELLAQGFRNIEKKTEEDVKLFERLRSRLIPFHMHVHADTVEAIHYISALLSDAPNISSDPYDPSSKITSKSLQKLIDNNKRSLMLQNPPDTVREHILAALQALLAGKWQQSFEVLSHLNMWRFVLNADKVKDILKRQLQETALKCHLLAHSRYYESISTDVLSNMFSLPAATVRAIASKLMDDDRLRASWHQPSDSIITYAAEPTKLQSIALSYAEKLSAVVDFNERILDQRSGVYNFKGDRNFGMRPQGGHQQGRQQGFAVTGGVFANPAAGSSSWSAPRRDYSSASAPSAAPSATALPSAPASSSASFSSAPVQQQSSLSSLRSSKPAPVSDKPAVPFSWAAVARK